MCRQFSREVVGVDAQPLPVPAHPALLARVPVRHAEPPSLVADEPVEAYAAAGAQVERQLVGHGERGCGRRARRGVLVGGDAVDRPAPAPGLPGAPLERLGVQVGGAVELPPRQEVALNEPDQPLDLALGERVPGLAQLRLEPDVRHERGIVGLPHRAAVRIAPEHHRLHVVGQDVLRHAHHRERVDHADEQALLAGVGKELHVAGAAMVAHHREARDPERRPGPVLHVDESPVHLVGLPGRCAKPSAAATPRVGSCEAPFGGNEIGMGGDVVLHGGLAALVALAPDTLEDNLRVGHAL